MKSVESVLRLEGSLWGERFVEDRLTDHATRSVRIGRIYARSTAMWPKNDYKHSEMGPVRQNPIQRTVMSVHMCVHCTVHNCCTQYFTEQTR